MQFLVVIVAVLPVRHAKLIAANFIQTSEISTGTGDQFNKGQMSGKTKDSAGFHRLGDYTQFSNTILPGFNHSF